MRKFILVLAMVLMFAIPTDAFKVHFTNDTDKTMVYHITWLTCDWEACLETGGVAHMGAGELKPGKTTVLGNPPYEYKAGVWEIDWDYLYHDRDDYVDIQPELIETFQHGVLVSKPDSLNFYPGI